MGLRTMFSNPRSRRTSAHSSWWIGLLTLWLCACAQARAPLGADPEKKRTRRLRMSDDVTVVATRWDAALVEATIAELPKDDRNAKRQRLNERYVKDRTSFTVQLELGNLEAGPHDMTGLADPKNWWFRLRSPGRSLDPALVEILAIDRFPGTGGRGHLRIAMLVTFEHTDQRRTETLRVGTRAKFGKRPMLGVKARDEGLALRWEAGGH